MRPNGDLFHKSHRGSGFPAFSAPPVGPAAAAGGGRIALLAGSVGTLPRGCRDVAPQALAQRAEVDPRSFELPADALQGVGVGALHVAHRALDASSWRRAYSLACRDSLSMPETTPRSAATWVPRHCRVNRSRSFPDQGADSIWRPRFAICLLMSAASRLM